MAELLLELLSEEIPARMQQEAAENLLLLLHDALVSISPNVFAFWTPRRIAAVATVQPQVPAASRTERGPRVGAPQAAIDGFVRKHGAAKDDLVSLDGYWILRIETAAQTARQLIAEAVPPLLRRFPWPKSMRWGSTSSFAWVRPLRRILCILDGDVVPFTLKNGADDGHLLESGNMTEGHRFMAPGAFPVTSFADWKAELLARNVVVDPRQRALWVNERLMSLVDQTPFRIVEDKSLEDEVSGLVEWPVPFLGQIDAAFMDLPPEVMQVSMRVNQRYFALRDEYGNAAPCFAFIANIEAPNGGDAAIVAGNERVLRARFADARHFWDLDRATTLESRVVALGAITFHAKLGTQADRVRRLVRLAAHIAPMVGADSDRACRAAELCKADLTTGMVGEFPELQGIMGAYYAAHDGEADEVVTAIRNQYRLPEFSDARQFGPVSNALGLADRIDHLVGFFGIGEKPTGSGDPYALRRAALGVVAIVTTGLRLRLRRLFEFAAAGYPQQASADELLAFVIERMRLFMRNQEERHDVLSAVFATGTDDDLTRLRGRVWSISSFLGTPDGQDLLALYRRAANILRIENKKDGPHSGEADPKLLTEPAEKELYQKLSGSRSMIQGCLDREEDENAMDMLAALRAPTDAFMTAVRVNDSIPGTRINRLRLLSGLVHDMNRVADFSLIEG